MSGAVQQRGGVGLAFANVTTLFFAWGFVTATIDPLIPSVRSIFKLSFAESMLTQFAFFMAYGIVSLPAAAVVARLGYARSILAALATLMIGCLLMPLATALDRYAVVLVALFVIASGVTLLQVAANPLAAALGSPERSHFRLTLSQAFNSLGTVLAPLAGAFILLGGGLFAHGAAGDAEARNHSLRAIDNAFFIIASAIAALGFLFFLVRGQISKAAGKPEALTSPLSAFRSGWALFGAAAIFLYVGAEVSIGSVMINFLSSKTTLGVPVQEASQLLSRYWLGAMVGRIIGSGLLTRLRVGPLLTGAALVAAVLCVTVSQTDGVVPAVAALSIGLFNSIMFPTIFTLTLERSSAPASATSGLLCMAIVGGAILPQFVGVVADHVGLSLSFLVPAAAYLGIAAFAFLAGRTPAVQAASTESSLH